MKRIFLYAAILIASLFVLVSCQQKAAEQLESQTIQLFNGQNLDGWYTNLKEKGLKNDPEGIFTVVDGMIRIQGSEFGYICTEKEYENYKVTIEYKWGDEKFTPDEKPHNSGLLYNFSADSTDKVWPYCYECQLMTGSVGDFILMGPPIVVNGEQGSYPDNRKFVKSENAEKPIGEWNTVQVIAEGNTATHIVNGVKVNYGTEAASSKGKILIQSEGAELFVRKVELELLK